MEIPAGESGDRPGSVAYVGIGSNMGDRAAQIAYALECLKRVSSNDRVTLAPIYETEPWGPVRQSPFLNTAVELETLLAPAALLSELRAIERLAGRRPDNQNWGPRSLDLDILLYGNRIIHSLQLSVPHPRLLERRFALLPLADLAPDVLIPGSGRTVRQALQECPDSGWIRPFTP